MGEPVRTLYTLEIGADLYAVLAEHAEHHAVPAADLVRKCLKLGLVALRVQDDPNAALILREGDRERELTLWSEPDTTTEGPPVDTAARCLCGHLKSEHDEHDKWECWRCDCRGYCPDEENPF